MEAYAFLFQLCPSPALLWGFRQVCSCIGKHLFSVIYVSPAENAGVGIDYILILFLRGGGWKYKKKLTAWPRCWLWHLPLIFFSRFKLLFHVLAVIRCFEQKNINANLLIGKSLSSCNCAVQSEHRLKVKNVKMCLWSCRMCDILPGRCTLSHFEWAWNVLKLVGLFFFFFAKIKMTRCLWQAHYIMRSNERENE